MLSDVLINVVCSTCKENEIKIARGHYTNNLSLNVQVVKYIFPLVRWYCMITTSVFV